ncbi:MAG: ABC transporter ATP-binding protein [Methanocellales archaeon]
MLEARGVTKNFGGLTAVKSVDLRVERGEIVGLVGPNGAGKTTLLNIISGIYKPDSGVIKFNGEDITGLKPNQICRKGIVKTFQLAQSFPALTAVESVMIGAIFGNHNKISMDSARKEAIEFLDYVGFPREKINNPVKNLNVVELKRVQLARALASKPKLLLLDEPTTGLNPREGAEAIELIKKLRESGITILMIEHVMRVIMGVSDRILVLDRGEKIAEGKPGEIANNKRVIDSYLGERYAF